VRDSWKTDIDRSTGSSSKSVTQKSSLPSNVPPIPIPLEKHTNDPAKDTYVLSPSSRSTHLSFRPRLRPKRSRTDFDATQSSYDRYISEGDYSTEASSSSDTDELVITSLGGRERITLRASEADDAQDDNTIRFHGRNSTAGLVEKARQFKHMHMREILSRTQLESTSPISPDNKTVAQTRRPEFWQTPYVRLFIIISAAFFLIFCLSGSSSMRVLVPILMKSLKRSFDTFLRQISPKLLLTSISAIQILYSLCYIVQPSPGNGINGYIIVISGLHVSVH
jgi:hypothetical protein